MLSKALGAQWQHHGPLGKVERLIFIMIFSLLEYLQLTGKISMIANHTYFFWLAVVFIVLGQVTVYNRVKAQLKEYKKLDWPEQKKELSLNGQASTKRKLNSFIILRYS